ncbi:hypothetical protein J5I95_10200 [Candidatus Poribacteria bacterium]|nr:hypothetical protein [Candidatus Poribacteria bacterium]
MLQKSFPILLLLMCYGTPISAHDAFYPHHREDFENMARRRELRTTVLLSTAAFLGVLGTIIYVALRKIRDDSDIDDVDTKTAQEHLEHAINRAANTAQQVLAAKGDVAEAATRCLTTYAEACGVTWQKRSYGQTHPESVPYQIRCKIGSDVVTLSINTKFIQLNVKRGLSKTGFGSQGSSKSASATVILERSDTGEA